MGQQFIKVADDMALPRIYQHVFLRIMAFFYRAQCKYLNKGIVHILSNKFIQFSTNVFYGWAFCVFVLYF